MPDFRKFTEKLKSLFPDKKLTLIVFLGIAGMALILISQFTSRSGDEINPQTPGEAEDERHTSGDYIAALEQKLCVLITSIEGVGRAQVMVTLENTGEYVYAQEEKRNVDKNIEPGPDGEAGKSYSKENIQQSYILMNGQKEALVKTHLEPKVQGVVIICEGAGNVRVKQSLINVVTTALNIPSTRVCVEKIS